MRVDLPAPLSPISPRTSPLLRCKLRSLSAVIGPKLLATCSTRNTSRSWPPGATAVSVPAVSTGNACALSNSLDEDVQRHRDDDRDPQVQVQVVRVRALEDQPVVEDAEEERADQCADHRTLAAGEQG